MGQIRGNNAHIDACNLRSLSYFGTPAAGQHILVSTDNSATADGQGNFDAYVEGDGVTAATALELKKINNEKVKKEITFTGGIYWNESGYYNASAEVVTNTSYSYSDLLNVSAYRGKTAVFNFTSGRSATFSGFMDSEHNITGTFQNVTSIVIPDNATYMFVTAIGNTAAVNSISISIDEFLDDLLEPLADELYIQNLIVHQSENATKSGYISTDGYTIKSGGYYNIIDVTKYRGCKVVFKPVYVGSTFTGFKLSDGTYLKIPVSQTSDFEYIVPQNAIELRASYRTTQTDRYVTFYVKKSIEDIYSDFLTHEEADSTYLKNDILKSEYTLDASEVVSGKYYDDNGNLKFANDFYAFKIQDLSNYHNVDWRGGTYKIGGTLYLGGAARCGIIYDDNTITLITSTSQWEGEITSNMKSIFLSFRTSINDAVVDLEVISETIVNEAQLSQAVASANNYTDQRLADAGIQKLPSSIKWYVLGDSISAYNVYVGAGLHYYELIAARNNMTFDASVQSLAADGRRVSYGSNSICNDVAALSAPQLITIFAGINDFIHDVPLGTLLDNDGYVVSPPASASEATDFASALLYILSNLKRNYPHAVIAYILPTKRQNQVTNTLGYRFDKYWEYIEKACEAYSIPVIPLGKACGLMYGSTYYIDNLHPNVMGQQIISYFVENYLSLLVPTEWT